MVGTSLSVGRSRNLVLAAMIFAVSMTFIDQTIVVDRGAADPTRARALRDRACSGRSTPTCSRCASFFAFGGRLADTLGHKKMVVLGVIVFAGILGHVRPDAHRRRGRSVDRDVPVHPGPGVVRSCSPPRWPSWCRRSTCTSGEGPWPCSSGSPAV